MNSRKIFVIIAISAVVCTLSAQVNILSNAINFRTTSNKAQRSYHYGCMTLNGTDGSNALSVTYSGTGSSNKWGVLATAFPATGYGYGGEFDGAQIGVKGAGGNGSGSSRPIYGGIFTADNVNTSSAQTYGINATATHGTTAYGIYASATLGGTNWAGYFSGNTYCTGTYQGSDERLKTNIRTLDNSLDKIMNLKPSVYEFDVDKFPKMGLEKGTTFGLVAQAVETIIPEVVKDVDLPEDVATADLKTIKSVNYTALIPVLIGAIQEQQKEIDALKKILTNAGIK